MDLRNAMVGFFYSQDLFEKSKDTFIATQALPHLQKMENWLVSNNTIYCASDTPCIADFHLWELLDQLELFAKCYKQESALKGRPKLEAVYSKIKGLEQLSNYFNDDLYTLPVNNPHASWTNAGELKVAYWAIRGLGAPLRMICEYSGAKW